MKTPSTRSYTLEEPVPLSACTEGMDKRESKLKRAGSRRASESAWVTDLTVDGEGGVEEGRRERWRVW